MTNRKLEYWVIPPEADAESKPELRDLKGVIQARGLEVW
jgi:hypothetical protein